MRLMRRLWLQYPSLHVFAGGNYDGPLVARARGGFGYEIEIVVKPEPSKNPLAATRSPLKHRWWPSQIDCLAPLASRAFHDLMFYYCAMPR